jgi:hypothetical protein
LKVEKEKEKYENKRKKKKKKKRVKRKRKNRIRIKPSGPKTRNSPLKKNLKSRSSCTRQSGEFPQVPERWLQQGRAHRARGRAK